MRFLPSATIIAVACLISIPASKAAPAFEVEHTQFDPDVIRIYATGKNGTTAAAAVDVALEEARRIAAQQDRVYFYVADVETVYHPNSVIRGESYTVRGEAKLTGGNYHSSGQITGSEIDVRYHGSAGLGSQVTKRSVDQGKNQVSVLGLPDDSYIVHENKFPWVAVTVRLLDAEPEVEGDMEQELYVVNQPEEQDAD